MPEKPDGFFGLWRTLFIPENRPDVMIHAITNTVVVEVFYHPCILCLFIGNDFFSYDLKMQIKKFCLA
jgi:hypothetical protein